MTRKFGARRTLRRLPPESNQHVMLIVRSVYLGSRSDELSTLPWRCDTMVGWVVETALHVAQVERASDLRVSPEECFKHGS